MKGQEATTQTVIRDAELASVFRQHVAYVLHSLRRLGVRPDDVEDLAHDVFIVVARKWSDYEPARPFKPWVFGIAVRVALAYRRRAGFSREVLSDDLTHRVAETPGPDAALDREHQRRLVHRALAAVADGRKEVFILHDLDGVAMPDIAAALGIPLNTGYSRLRLARDEFRAELARLRGKEEAHG